MKMSMTTLFAVMSLSVFAWAPVKCPTTETMMLTEWGEKITPENAWRSYPRPQMVRDNWTCLNGLWDYAVTAVTNTPGRPCKWDGQILVPFGIESPLSGVGRILEPHEFLWYTRKIDCAPKKGERILLHFDGVDFRAMVFIGHTEVTDVPHAGAQEPFTLDITDYVKSGENELTVCVWDPTENFVNSRGKQSLEPKGCFYTRYSGIWQSVWMESVPETYITDYNVVPDIDKGIVTFKFDVTGVDCEEKVVIEVFDGDERVAKGKGDVRNGVVIEMPDDFKLWSPEQPNLYTFKAEYEDDKISGHFAMRKFSKAKDAKGILRFFLNNKPYFIVGTLDQGWWPDGLLTPPSEEAMAYDIAMLKKCGFNMMRKHIKVEPRRYYALCDKMGILVLQDLPCFSGDMYDPVQSDTIFGYGFQRQELKSMIDNLRKVPSIVMWIPYNEGWAQPGEFLTHSTFDWVARYEPSRLVNGPSGAWDFEGGHCLPKGWAWDKRVTTKHKPACECEAADAVDMHLYRGPAMFDVNDRRVSFLGEFGGLGHPVEGHLWKVNPSGKGNWGYGGIKDTSTREGLEKAYLDLMDKVTDLAKKGLGGSVYTQTTDVEIEINGIMSYDRKVLKYNAEVISAAHRKMCEAAAEAAK